MKKFSAKILCLLLMFAMLTGCGTNTNAPASQPEASDKSEASDILETSDESEISEESESLEESLSSSEPFTSEEQDENALAPVDWVGRPTFPKTMHDEDSSGLVVDQALADAAREFHGYELGQTLTEEDYAAVTDIRIFDEPVISLDGIEYFTSLQIIYISSGYIRDISGLAQLPELSQVDISWCYIETIPDFSNCPNLEMLYLGANMISDLTPLQNAQSIQYLMLSSNRITSVAPLASMENLEYLDLSGNGILDWETVKDNTKLQNALQWDYQDALKVQNYAQEILDGIITEDMSDLEKQIAICEEIHRLMDYELVETEQSPFGYHALMDKIGVCGDFSEAVTLLCTMAGLEVICCDSDTHAWNMIRLDGKWYEFDCMWDDEIDRADWQYFNLSREEMGQDADHQLDLFRYPLAQ